MEKRGIEGLQIFIGLPARQMINVMTSTSGHRRKTARTRNKGDEIMRLQAPGNKAMP